MAKDAPVCCDCHGAHDIQAKSNPASKTSKARLAKTCEKCHDDVRTEFAEQYGKMIHGSDKVRSDNPVVGMVEGLFNWVDSNVIDRIAGYYNAIQRYTVSLVNTDKRIWRL